MYVTCRSHDMLVMFVCVMQREPIEEDVREFVDAAGYRNDLSTVETMLNHFGDKIINERCVSTIIYSIRCDCHVT
jgi:hypothetical protein